jgi:mRNA interferase MazF
VNVPVAAGVRQESELLVDQLRAIDNRRLVQGPLTRLAPELMEKVAVAIGDVLELH